MVVPLGYQLIRSRKRRKTISLHIKEDGRVILYTPFHTSKWEIERFIKEKEPWIVEKLSEKEKLIREVEKAFIPGERFLFLGEGYPLEIQDNHSKGYPLKLSFGNSSLIKIISKRQENFLFSGIRKKQNRR